MFGIVSLAATWMGLESVILSEVREGEMSYDSPYMWNLKGTIQMDLLTKQRLREQTYGCQGEG